MEGSRISIRCMEWGLEKSLFSVIFNFLLLFRVFPPALFQGESGPDMPWCHDYNIPGGASGRGLAQSEETSTTQNQSCAKTTPTPPTILEIT